MFIINNIATWVFPQPKDSIDPLSLLPTNAFENVLSHLPIEDLVSFKCTKNKIQSLVETAIFHKTQNFLEHVKEELLQQYDVKISLKNHDIFESYHLSNEKAKNLKKGSLEKCHAMRGAICSLFQNRSLDYTLEKLKSFHLLNDKLLLPEIFKSRIDYNHNDSKVNWRRSDEQNDKNLILFLKVLKKNQSDIKKFTLEIFKNPLSEKVLNILLRAISENHSLKTINISVQAWNSLHLKTILEAVKKNEGIDRISISEISYDQTLENCWWWQRQAQEKHVAELNRIVQNHLKDVSYNQGNWTFKK